MGSRLRADLVGISDLGSGLRDLQDRFAEVFITNPDGFGQQAGVDVLGQALTEFNSDWGIRQANLLNDLADLARLADMAATAFASTDQDLAKALTQALTPPPQAVPHHHPSRMLAE